MAYLSFSKALCRVSRNYENFAVYIYFAKTLGLINHCYIAKLCKKCFGLRCGKLITKNMDITGYPISSKTCFIFLLTESDLVLTYQLNTLTYLPFNAYNWTEQQSSHVAASSLNPTAAAYVKQQPFSCTSHTRAVHVRISHPNLKALQLTRPRDNPPLATR